MAVMITCVYETFKQIIQQLTVEGKLCPMNEYEHLMHEYLYKNSLIKNGGVHAMTTDDIRRTIYNLQVFESPDMFAILDDKIVIIEHFEFDASKCTKKGMMGKREERLLQQRMFNAPVDDILHLDSVNYDISFENWISNFTQTFDSHYEKIPQYKSAIRNHLKNKEDAYKEIVVGFFIENQFSPIVQDKTNVGELYFFDTLQFAQKIMSSGDLGFVLFGSYYEGRPQIFYLDKETYYNGNVEKLTNLKNTDIQLSRLNKSEFVVYELFSDRIQDYII